MAVGTSPVHPPRPRTRGGLVFARAGTTLLRIRREIMSRDHPNERQVPVGSALVALPSTTGGQETVRDHRFPADGRPRLHVRRIERTALIRFEDAEFLFDEEVIRSLGEQLDRLIKDERHSHLIVNLGGVRYPSSAVPGKPAWLAKQVEPVGGRISLC